MTEEIRGELGDGGLKLYAWLVHGPQAAVVSRHIYAVLHDATEGTDVCVWRAARDREDEWTIIALGTQATEDNVPVGPYVEPIGVPSEVAAWCISRAAVEQGDE